MPAMVVQRILVRVRETGDDPTNWLSIISHIILCTAADFYTISVEEITYAASSYRVIEDLHIWPFFLAIYNSFFALLLL